MKRTHESEVLLKHKRFTHKEQMISMSCSQSVPFQRLSQNFRQAYATNGFFMRSTVADVIETNSSPITSIATTEVYQRGWEKSDKFISSHPTPGALLNWSRSAKEHCEGRRQQIVNDLFDLSLCCFPHIFFPSPAILIIFWQACFIFLFFFFFPKVWPLDCNQWMSWLNSIAINGILVNHV